MRRSVAIVVAAVTVGLALRVYLLGHLDLRGWPGPAAPDMLVAGLLADGSRQWAGWLVTGALPLVDGDVLAAGTLLKLVATALGCAGAALAGHAIGGRVVALAAGLLGGSWGLALYVSVLGGADAPSWGLLWFGVGLAWWGARMGPRALPLVALGGGLAALGVAVKFAAAPALAYLAIAPLLAVRRGVGQGIGVTIAIGLGVWLLTPWLSPPPGGPDARLADLQWEHVVEGLRRLDTLDATERMAEGLFDELWVLALVGAALPGRAWLPRVALLVGGAALVALPASSWNVGYDVGYRPRWALPSGLGFVVLAAAAVALPLRRLRLLGGLRHLPGVGLAAYAACDGLAFLHAWSEHRVAHEEAAPLTAWIPPERFTDRYADQAELGWWSTSTEDGIGLYTLAGTAPSGGLMLPMLQDGRESHALLGAAVAGVWPAVASSPELCCEGGEAREACAQRVVAALDAAGAMIIVPADPAARCASGVAAWSSSLYNAATELGPFRQSGAWFVWTGSGSGGDMPCVHGGSGASDALEGWRYQ